MNSIPLYWHKEMNFGDALSPLISEYVSGKQVKFNLDGKTYLCIGSIFHHIKNFRGMKAEVWGSGMMCDENVKPPEKIYAVRGPLSRKALLRQNIECPDIYGDPALLLPLYFNPEREIQYEYGIVPHFVDFTSIQTEHSSLLSSNVLLIDVKRDPLVVVQDILKCQKIFSSSLHGLIVANAYNIPSAWVKITDKVKGNGFKFFDYLCSANIENYEPHQICNEKSIADLARYSTFVNPHIETERLLEVCPFK